MADLIGEIAWYRGDSYPVKLTIKDKTTSVEIDLTGYTFLLTVDSDKNPSDTSTKVFEVAGILEDQGTNTGEVTFTPTTSNTDLSPLTYYYDIQMTDASGNIRTIAKNKWKITQDITK